MGNKTTQPISGLNPYIYSGKPIPDLPPTLKHFKSPREISETIIFGFIRSFYQNKVYNSPQDIIDLCLLFYCICDEFEDSFSDPRLIFNKQLMMVSKPDDCQEILRYYAFGKFSVQRGQKRLWKFYIASSEFHRVTISVGIIPTNIIKKHFSEENDYLYDQSRYQLMLKNGKISNGMNVSHYCLRPIKRCDVIEMELDMSANHRYATLEYCLNDISLGVAFDQIPNYGSYTLCVSFERRDQIQIIPRLNAIVRQKTADCNIPAFGLTQEYVAKHFQMSK